MEFEFDRSPFMTWTSEKYHHSPVKPEPKRMSDYFQDAWCFNLTLILINGLVILSTAGFLVGKEDGIKKCSTDLYWTATIFEMYLGGVIVRYFLFALCHSCGLCESSGLKPYQPTDKLESLKKRFTVHLVFSFSDLLILTPITVKASNVLGSSRAQLCGKIAKQNLVWIHICQILQVYACLMLFMAFIVCCVGVGVWYFWLKLDKPIVSDNFERAETEDSQGCLTSFAKIKNGERQNLFNQEGSTLFEKENLESLRKARDHSRSFIEKLQEANETELRRSPDHKY